MTSSSRRAGLWARITHVCQVSETRDAILLSVVVVLTLLLLLYIWHFKAIIALVDLYVFGQVTTTSDSNNNDKPALLNIPDVCNTTYIHDIHLLYLDVHALRHFADGASGHLNTINHIDVMVAKLKTRHNFASIQVIHPNHHYQDQNAPAYNNNNDDVDTPPRESIYGMKRNVSDHQFDYALLHRKAWKHVATGASAWVMVVEDTSHLLDNAHMHAYPTYPAACSHVYLGPHKSSNEWSAPLCRNDGEYKLRLAMQCYGAGAYLINQSGARRLLALSRVGFDMPVEMYMGTYGGRCVLAQ